MAKKIILCSDGTGNKGGDGPDTNVFRIYKYIDNDTNYQITFYDDGIGTESSSTVWQTFAGAFGFGFKKNIKTMYRYLVKHYKPGDKIYLFGFSRGAATVRALAGMICAVGLIKKDNVSRSGIVDNIKLYLEIRRATRIYKSGNKQKAEEYKKKTHGSVDIEMIGVWDTVDALGFPKDSSWLVIGFSRMIDWLTNKLFRQHCYDFQLDSNVKNVYHALAIDDTRYTFHPMLWDETAENRPQNIEQVWFAGAHANVGGGYDRTELSSIALHWMMKKAQYHGIKFFPDKLSDVNEEINVSGKLYNPRKGIWTYYRFKPRHMRDLSEGKLTGDIKIHESVLDRMRLADYNPILPNKFEVVADRPRFSYVEDNEYTKIQKKRINLFHKIKLISYHLFVEVSVILAGIMWYLNYYTELPEMSGLGKSILDMFPGSFQKMLYFSTVEHPLFGLSILGFFLSLYVVKRVNRYVINRSLKKLNTIFISNLK
jgi:hypothetical protein